MANQSSKTIQNWLSCDIAGLRVENEGNGACMFVRESELDGASGAGSPARQFLAVGDHVVEDVHWHPQTCTSVNFCCSHLVFVKASEGESPVCESGMWFTRNTACLTSRGHRMGSATSGSGLLSAASWFWQLP